jgi:hypothetical protein
VIAEMGTGGLVAIGIVIVALIVLFVVVLQRARRG